MEEFLNGSEQRKADDGDKFYGHLISQSMGESMGGDPQLVLTFQLRPEWYDAQKNEKVMGFKSLESVFPSAQVRITFKDNADSLTHARRDLKNLGAEGVDPWDLDPMSEGFMDLVEKNKDREFVLRAQAKSSGNGYYWNFLWELEPKIFKVEPTSKEAYQKFKKNVGSLWKEEEPASVGTGKNEEDIPF